MPQAAAGVKCAHYTHLATMHVGGQSSRVKAPIIKMSLLKMVVITFSEHKECNS